MIQSSESKFSAQGNVAELNPKENLPSTGGELVIGVLVDVNSPGQPRVSYPGMHLEQPVSALATVPINKDHIGRQVALLFTNDNLRQPVVIGLIQTFLDENHHSDSRETTSANVMLLEDRKNVHETKIDGKRLVFEAENEVEIKCGKASIVLTKAGKVLIRGKYLSARSSGVNRIKGGSVLIN